MSVSVPGIISALSMKPMPPMLARSIANNFAALAAEAAAPPEKPAPAQPVMAGRPDASGRLDQRF